MASSFNSRLGTAPEEGCKAPVKTVANSPITLSGEQTIGTVDVTEGDRVLVNGQTNQAENGIYDVKTTVWTFATDWNQTDDVIAGMLVPVSEDVALYQLQVFTGEFVAGTTEVTFQEFLSGNLSLPIDSSDVDHDTGMSVVDLEVYLQGEATKVSNLMDYVFDHDTVALMLAEADDTRSNVVVSTGGYTTLGDTGSARYKRIPFGSFGGTPDGLTDMVDTIDGTTWVYSLIDDEGRWKSARKWGLGATNLDAVITAMKTKLGADNAAIDIPAGDFTKSATIDIDCRGAGSIGQGVAPTSPATILRQSVDNIPSVTIVKSKQHCEGFTTTYNIDHQTSVIQTNRQSIGILVASGTAKAHCYIKDVSVNYAYCAMDFLASMFGSYIDIRANWCYKVATGNEVDTQTSLVATFKALGCFNGINVPKLNYCVLRPYFDQCGLVPDDSTYVPASILPIMLEADTWRNVVLQNVGFENTVAPAIRGSGYSTVTMHFHAFMSFTRVWSRTFDGLRTTIETPNDLTQTLMEAEQAVFICDTGGIAVHDLYLNNNSGSDPTAAATDTPWVYNRVAAPGSDSGVHFHNCTITHKSYIVKDQGFSDEFLGYDALTDTIYVDDEVFSQSGNSRIFLNHIDGDGSHLLKRVTDPDYANRQIRYSSDRYSYSFYKELTGTSGHNAIQVRVESQSSSSVMSVIEIEVMDSQLNRTANFYNSAKFFVNSLTSVNPVFDPGQHLIESFNCTASSGGGRDTYIRRTNGNFSTDLLVKVTVKGAQVRWHQNPTSLSDSGRSSLILTPANITSFNLP